jgi:hypothetical protein
MVHVKMWQHCLPMNSWSGARALLHPANSKSISPTLKQETGKCVIPDMSTYIYPYIYKEPRALRALVSFVACFHRERVLRALVSFVACSHIGKVLGHLSPLLPVLI